MTNLSVEINSVYIFSLSAAPIITCYVLGFNPPTRTLCGILSDIGVYRYIWLLLLKMISNRKRKTNTGAPFAQRIFSGLRFRLIALVLLGVIPALGLILYTAAEQRRYAKEEVQESALRLAWLVAADHERLLDEARQLLLTLAYIPEVSSGSQPACNQILAELLGQYPQYANLGVIGMDGSLLCNGVMPGSDINLAKFPFVERALREREFIAGDYQLDPITGNPTITFSYPVIDESDYIRSVVFASLNLNWLNQLVTAAQLPEGAVLVVLDRKGAVLVYSPDPEVWLGRRAPEEPLFARMLERGEGAAELAGPDGINRLYGFTRLAGSTGADIFVGIGVSKEAAFARVNAGLYRHLAGLSVVILLAMGAAWIGGDLFILRRLQAILEATQKLASGDLSARTGLPYGQGELSQLARVFDHLGEVLEQRETERVQSEREIKRHIRDLAALNTITATVSSSLELPEVLESLKRLLSEQFNVPGGAIFFFDEIQDTLRLEAAWGLPAASLADFKTVPAGSFHYKQVIEQGEAFLESDFRQVEPYAFSGLSHIRPNLMSYLCIPLHAKGQVQGVIDLFSQAPDVFTPDQGNLFKTMGQEVGVAIQNARFFEQVNSGRERLLFLSQQLMEVQENERRHIARELHDEIGQALTAVKVNLQTISRLSGTAELIPHMEESIGLIDRTIQQVRNLSLDLRPSLLDDLGVVSTLRWYIDRQAQRAGLDAHFNANLSEERLPAEIETACFRIVQEALTNVVRHANANKVSVAILQFDNELEVVIRDDGIGFDVDKVKVRSAGDTTLGLLGMKERVELVGGQIEIRSSQAYGTEICAHFPLQKEKV